MTNNIQALSSCEIDEICGGVNWGEIAGGGAVIITTGLAIMAAPATAGTSLLVAGAVLGAASGAVLIADGVSN
jgi:hypothetical protein